jgi:hypothetical protein
MALRGLRMRVTLAVALLGLLASACSSIEWSAPTPSDAATGSPAPDVGVFELSNAEYFDTNPAGTVSVRPAYRETISIVCDTGWGRSCVMGVGIAKGAACFCNTAWGPVAGQAS